MKYTFLVVILLLLLSACGEKKELKSLNGKKLLEQKCVTCHNLDMPPTLLENELAPPMMSVSFHVHRFMKPSDESKRIAKAIEFVVDYVQNPSVEKSFCDKKSLKRYGLMPSQKESVTVDEAEAIAVYMFAHYTQENLTKTQKEQALYEALDEGKKIALKYKCLGCHRVDKKIVGPSLLAITQKYQEDREYIKMSIKNGSSKKWSKKGAVMPAFKNISNEELDILTEWIIELKE